MPTADTPTPAKIFRTNFKKAFGQYRAETGESLSLFGERHFGGGETIYNWLRRLWDEGAAFKREGKSNHDRLKKLHAALGVAWPSLWDQPKQIGNDLVERLSTMMSSDRGAEVEKAVTETLDKFDNVTGAERLLSRLENERPDLYQFMIDKLGAKRVLESASGAIAKGGFEAAWEGLLKVAMSNIPAASSAQKIEVPTPEPHPTAKPVPTPDDIMHYGMRVERNGKSWWSEYVEDLDDEEAAFASLPQKWVEYAGTENDPSVAGFWKSWMFGSTEPGHNLPKQPAPDVELPPRDKLLAAIQNHSDWDRYVEKIGTVDAAIARAQSAIGSTDEFLAENSPNYWIRWADKLLRKELGK